MRFLLGAAVVWLLATYAPVDADRLSDTRLQLAYVDPGAGSLVFQVVVAVVAGMGVAARAYWDKIKGFFGSSSEEAPAEADPAGDAPADE